MDEDRRLEDILKEEILSLTDEQAEYVLSRLQELWKKAS
jgi:hypothetical protein